MKTVLTAEVKTNEGFQAFSREFLFSGIPLEWLEGFSEALVLLTDGSVSYKITIAVNPPNGVIHENTNL